MGSSDLAGVFDFIKWFINFLVITVGSGLIFFLFRLVHEVSALKGDLSVQIKYLAGEIRNLRGVRDAHDSKLVMHDSKLVEHEKTLQYDRDRIKVHQKSLESHTRAIQRLSSEQKSISRKVGLSG